MPKRCYDLKKLSYFLIITGIILLITPFAGSKITSWQQERLIQEYQESDLVPEPETVDAPSPALLETEDDQTSLLKEPVKEVKKPDAQVKALGRIKIPKIDLDLPIIKGVGKSALRQGIGYMTESGPIGKEGNAVLAGHRNYPFGRMFSRLDELQIDDQVIVEVDKKTYRYVIYEKLVVEPNDVSVIKGKGNRKVLTLVTCTPPGKDTHRLIIHASMD